MIPLGVDWTATATGEVIKLVRCEQCSHEYGYMLRRKIDVSTFSVLGLDSRSAARASEREAARRLQNSLQKSCDPVPCPACRWYQEAMIKRACKTRLVWLNKVAIAMVPLSILVPIFLLKAIGVGVEQYRTAGVLMGSLLACAAALLLVRRVLSRSYDPNGADPATRIATGGRLSLSPAEFARAKAMA